MKQKRHKNSPEKFMDSFNTLVALLNQGRYTEGEAIARELTVHFPYNGACWKALGAFLGLQGKSAEAVRPLQKATKLLPADPEAHSNLGAALQDQGRLVEAEASYLKALAIRPGYAEAHYNLGITLKDQGRLMEAEASYLKALAIKPDYAEAHRNLGIALQEQGRLMEAEASYLKALAIKPDYADAHNNLGIALQGQGRLMEAEASYLKALAIKPDYAEAHRNLGIALQDQGRLMEAEASYLKALAIKPDYAEAHNNLGIALQEQGRLMEAEASYLKALAIKPDYAEAHNNLGNTHKDQGRLTEAEASYLRALAIKPDYAEKAHSNLLFVLAHNGATQPEEYLTRARSWDLTATAAWDRRAAGAMEFCNPPLRGRPLKIGYVSGDFRQHSVSYFIEKLFSGHNRERCEVFAYSTHLKADDVTRRLQGMADHWTLLFGMTDTAAAERIRKDGIDVLIDLSGHTAFNRLKIFALRSAPVQAHYLGFFASTGLAEMDYWIGDEVLIPEKDAGYYSEKIWRLPRAWISYYAGDGAPVPAWQSDPSGDIWFGSFNSLYKITPESIRLWARVLKNCPQGRLLLKTAQFADPATRERLLKEFAAEGIFSDRIFLVGNVSGWREHMALYDRLDVALDPVGGVCGGTTTCDALWMGVPVITLAGACMARRMSASMLTSMGRTEWIAQSADEYVEKALSLAGNVTARRDARFSQRERMERSPLCDTQGLVYALEDAYKKMFTAWQESRRQSPPVVAINAVESYG